MVGKTSNRDSQSINAGGCKGASKKCQGTRYFAFTFNSPMLIVHAVVSVCAIYVVCTVIDQIRIWAVEKPFFKVLEKRGI